MDFAIVRGASSRPNWSRVGPSTSDVTPTPKSHTHAPPGIAAGSKQAQKGSIHSL